MALARPSPGEHTPYTRITKQHRRSQQHMKGLNVERQPPALHKQDTGLQYSQRPVCTVKQERRR